MNLSPSPEILSSRSNGHCTNTSHITLDSKKMVSKPIENFFVLLLCNKYEKSGPLGAERSKGPKEPPVGA